MAQKPGAEMPLGFGAGIGIGTGTGINVLAHGLGFFLMILTVNDITDGDPGLLAYLWPYLTIGVVGIVMMFFAKTRSIGTGILIVSAALWLIIIGPCVALLTGLH